jgi:hypothetical protein
MEAVAEGTAVPDAVPAGVAWYGRRAAVQANCTIAEWFRGETPGESWMETVLSLSTVTPGASSRRGSAVVAVSASLSVGPANSMRITGP